MPFARRTPKEPMDLPPVTAASGGPEMRIEGRRLSTLGMRWLRVTCACGHEGRVAVPELADRHGGDTRVRQVAEKLQCSQCGQARVRRIALSD
ncbi:hypothetical protein [Ruegeria sp.]|uniref:hypothetical protein n=1 Tax=Ruegeria sp. TaxID=1879320 RepID=UPI003B00EB2B